MTMHGRGGNGAAVSPDAEMGRLRRALHTKQRVVDGLQMVTRVIRESPDLDGMLRGVLEAFLELFGCDRAWLLSPCDPSASAYTVPMEVTRPAWPGAGVTGEELPVSTFAARLFQAALDARGALLYDPEKLPIDPAEESTRQFCVRSQIVLALRPGVGPPWLLGIHHCAEAVVYTDADRELFEAAGGSLAAGLRGWLSQQDARRAEQILSNSPVVAFQWGLGPGWPVAFVSDNVAGLTGYTAAEFRTGAVTYAQIVHPEDLPRVETEAERAIDSPDVGAFEHAPYRIVARDGREKWVRDATTMIREPGQRASEAVGLVHDITPRVELEQELLDKQQLLEEAQERFAAVVSATRDGIYDWNLESEEIYFSDSWKRMLGYEPDELPNEFSLWEELTAPADVKKSWAMLEAHLKGERDRFELEIKMRHKDGHWVDILSRAQSVRDASGKPLRVVGTHVDISERKEWSERLERQRFLLEKSQELGRIGTWELDLVVDQLVWTDENCRIFGVPEGSEVTYETFLEKVHPEDRSSVHREWTAALDGEPYDIEHRLLVDGAVRWVREKAVVQRDAAGRAVKAIGFTQDVTERRRLEQEVRDEHLKYTTFLGATRTAPWELDLATGRFTFVGQQIEDLLGYPRSHWRGLASWIDVIHPQDRDWVQAHRERETRAGHDLDLVYRAVRSDGEVLWVQDAVSVISGAEGPERLVGFLHDVTQREEALHALQQSEERFQRLFNEAPLAYQSLDEDGRLVEVNDTWLRVLGYARDEVVGRSFEAFLEPEFRHRFHEGFPRFKRAGEIHGIEHVMRNKSGERVYVAFEGKVAYREDGSMKQTHCILNDVTRAKAEAEERRKLEEQLQQSQKLESIGTLAGGVAHDFNNALMVILGNTEEAAEALGEGHPATACLQEVRRAAQHSADLTRQLLAFARKQIARPRPLDLNEAVSAALNMLRRLIGESIELRWNPAAALGDVNIDPGQVDQILANLATNARDAIAGVGTVSIATGEAVLDQAMVEDQLELAPGEYVRLSFSDTGRGMDDDTLAKVFEPFYTTKGLGKGTGLGLSTVYGIVKQNGGEIHVYSEPGRGTTFTIYLPRHRRPGVAPGAAPQPQEAPLRGHETVLLVEDEPALLKVCTAMLEGLGYTVLAAGTPEQAARLAEGAEPEIHLLMTDVVMPGMTGRDLAERVQGIHPGLAVLFMSGYTADVISSHGVVSQGLQFIQKPFSRQALARKLRDVLGGPSGDA